MFGSVIKSMCPIGNKPVRKWQIVMDRAANDNVVWNSRGTEELKVYGGGTICFDYVESWIQWCGILWSLGDGNEI